MNLAEIKENKQTNKISRRKMLSILCISGLSASAFVSCAPNATSLKNDTQPGSVAGTPRQFMPSNGPDAQPFVNDIQKYPKCPYCGMNRKQWNHSRHLVHYSDDLVDPTCSLHCVAISLSLNLDRGPKAIYAADFGSDSKIKPLLNVDNALDEDYFCEKCNHKCHCNLIICDNEVTLKRVKRYARQSSKFSAFKTKLADDV